MAQLTKAQLDQAVRLVDEARQQIEVEVTALNRLLREGEIESTDYTKRQAELRQEKVSRIQPEIADVLVQARQNSATRQSRYLTAAYDHLASGRATLEAFAWRDAQRAARLHSEAACRREKEEERADINRQAQHLTLKDLFPTQS